MIYKDFALILNKLKAYGPVVTNIFPDCVDADAEIDCLESDKACVFYVADRYRYRTFFAVVNDEKAKAELCTLMEKLPDGVVLEWLQRGNVDENFQIIPEEYNNCNSNDLFKKCGFSLYKKFLRIATTYTSNPYLLPEEGRRRILWESYEPCGEYPTLDDVNELHQITYDTFDTDCDDVFTPEEWKKIIQEKRCLVYREEGEITAYYVWELQGKKLYSNTSVNRGPANHLYNMERRVFEEYWDKGIRTFYAWVDIKNHHALKRGKILKECIKGKSVLYDYIYKKT